MNKKTFLMVVAFCCITVSGAFAQESIKINENSSKGIYFRIGGGYSLGTGRTSGGGNGLIPANNVSVIDHSEYRKSFDVVKIDEETQNTTKTNAAFSLGKGVNVSLALGYMFSEYVGLELGVNYLYGMNSMVTDESSVQNYHYTITSIGNNRTRETQTDTRSTHSKINSMKRDALTLTPAVRLVAPMSDRLSMYSRLGIVLPISDKMFYEYSNSSYSSYNNISSSGTRSNGSSRNSENKKMEFSSYFNLGYTAAIGVDYKLGKTVSLFGEVNLISASFEAKKSTVTEWTSSSNGNDKDLLKDMDIRDRETDYLKKYVVTDNTPSPGKDDPKKDISFSLPASSIGITVGLICRF